MTKKILIYTAGFFSFPLIWPFFTFGFRSFGHLWSEFYMDYLLKVVIPIVAPDMLPPGG